MRMVHRLSAGPDLLPVLRAALGCLWSDVVADMHTARRAAGGNTAFTVAVVLVILLVAGGLVWRAFHGEPDPPPSISAQGK